MWSGRIETCGKDLDVKWTRECDKDRYLSCIQDIMEKYEIRNQSDSGNLLNDISRIDRINFDTIDDELNCLYEFCPWTPEDTIKGTVLIFTFFKP